MSTKQVYSWWRGRGGGGGVGWTHPMGKMIFAIACLDTLPVKVTAMLRIKKLSSQSSLIFCKVEAIWLNWLVIDSSIPNSLYTSWSCASIRPVTTFRWGLKQWQWPMNINSKCEAKTRKRKIVAKRGKIPLKFTCKGYTNAPNKYYLIKCQVEVFERGTELE